MEGKEKERRKTREVGWKGIWHVPWDVIEEAYNEVRHEHEFFRGGNLWKGNRQKAKLWGRKSSAGTLSMIFHDNNASMDTDGWHVSLFLFHLSMKGITNWKNVQSVNIWENLCYTNLFSSKIMEWLWFTIENVYVHNKCTKGGYVIMELFQSKFVDINLIDFHLQ